MADEYGSRAKPVAQDPFQQIVEVHWAGGFLMATFGFKTDSTPEGERGTGPGPDLVNPFSEAYVTSATPAYEPAQPAFKVSSGSSFVIVDSAEVAISGIPAAPGAAGFDTWAVQGITVAVNGLFAPFIRFLAPTGGHPDISLPSRNTWFTTLTGQGELVAQEFISAPQPLPVGGDVPLWATFNPALVQKSTFGLDMSGLTAVYKERTYAALALRVSGQMEFNTGTLDVLLKRQTA